MINHKVPPQSIEGEMSVLGAILVDNQCIHKVRHHISADDFYREPHRLIYSACLDLAKDKAPIDMITMVDLLRHNGSLNQVGGAAYLATLIDYVPTAANVLHYAKIVHEQALKRRMLSAAMRMIDMAHDEHCDLQDAISESRSLMADISGSAHSASAGDIYTLEQRVERYIKYVSQVGSLRFRTGFGEIDNAIRGVAPGEVMTIIAYSGTFKSALLQNLLQGNAERTGLRQLMCSLEMPVEKCVEREVQIQCGLEGRAVEDAFRDKLWKDLYATLLRRKSDKVLVCDRPRLSVEKVSAYIDIARAKHGELGGVGIDYLGLMAAEGRTLFDKVSALSADLKGMAKEQNIPVVLLGQVHRGFAQSKGIEIEMDAAKGGGDIEAGADYMLGLWAKDDKLFAKLLKNRNGPVGQRWEIDIDRDTLTFRGTLPFNEQDQEPEPSHVQRYGRADLPKW
ncbi:replicative DNA helicase [Oryzomonas rubra]|uniref:replicative DNA helicase n=1 Tax=Oryzomonas rubra TaxID=2509454 RepID=UPI00165E9783|nr:replicative DNA helicase [Oryzomonas rubra]